MSMPDRDQLRRLLRDAETHAATWEHHGRVPRAVLRRLTDSGLLAGDLHLSRMLDVAEVLPHSGSRCLSTAVVAQLLVMRYVACYGCATKNQLLEPLCQGRTWAAPALPQSPEQIATWRVHAQRQDEHWLISGSCSFLGGGGGCDLVLLAAVTGRQDDGEPVLSLLLLDLDSAGVTVEPRRQANELTPDDGRMLRLQGCAVPARSIIGEPNQGGTYLAEQHAVLQLLAAATALSVADLARNGLPAAAADALGGMIGRARRAIRRAAARQSKPGSFRRACARAERQSQRAVERLQSAQLRASGTWGLLDRCWHGLSIRPLPSQPSPELAAGKRQPQVTPALAEARGPRPSLEQLLTSLPERFRAERADGWSATFHFVLAGADQPEWTVSINDADCRVEAGLNGDPGCVVRMKAATYLGIELGETNPQAAFLTGRIKISDPALMLRYLKLFRPYISGSLTGIQR